MFNVQQMYNEIFLILACLNLDIEDTEGPSIQGGFSQLASSTCGINYGSEIIKKKLGGTCH